MQIREVMTIDEIGDYLRLADQGTRDIRSAVKRLVYRNGLPAVQVGRSLVFPKAAVDRWLVVEADAHTARVCPVKTIGKIRKDGYPGQQRPASSGERRNER